MKIEQDMNVDFYRASFNQCLKKSYSPKQPKQARKGKCESGKPISGILTEAHQSVLNLILYTPLHLVQLFILATAISMWFLSMCVRSRGRNVVIRQWLTALVSCWFQSIFGWTRVWLWTGVVLCVCVCICVLMFCKSILMSLCYLDLQANFKHVLCLSAKAEAVSNIPHLSVRAVSLIMISVWSTRVYVRHVVRVCVCSGG